MYCLKLISLGNPEFKQRILIMHRHTNSQGKYLATLQGKKYMHFPIAYLELIPQFRIWLQQPAGNRDEVLIFREIVHFMFPHEEQSSKCKIEEKRNLLEDRKKKKENLRYTCYCRRKDWCNVRNSVPTNPGNQWFRNCKLPLERHKYTLLNQALHALWFLWQPSQWFHGILWS